VGNAIRWLCIRTSRALPRGVGVAGISKCLLEGSDHKGGEGGMLCVLPGAFLNDNQGEGGAASRGQKKEAGWLGGKKKAAG